MARKTLNNVEINVEFEEPSSRQSLDSGEKVNTLFGKIKRWLSDLKAVAFSGSWKDLGDKPTFLTGGSQTSASAADGGNNVYTFTTSDGKTSTFTVKNGTKGSKGDTGAAGKGISATDITYQVSSSGTVAPSRLGTALCLLPLRVSFYGLKSLLPTLINRLLPFTV